MALGQLVVRLGLDAAEFTQGMSKAEAEALRFGQKMGADIRTAALGAAAAITAVAAAGVARCQECEGRLPRAWAGYRRQYIRRFCGWWR